MKIIHVTSGLVRAGAGVREMILELARAQIDLGAEVEVIGLDHPQWLEQMMDWEGIHTTALPVLGPRGLGYAPAMEKTILRRNPDIVHLHGLWMHPGRSVMQWARRTGRPYVLSPHGMLSPIALTYGRIKKGFVSRWFQNAVFAQAAALHVTSEQERLDAQSYGLRQHVFIFPNGVKPVSPPPIGELQQGGTILSLGRVHSIKGLDQLILAWSKLEADFPEWRVKIVGPDQCGETARLSRLVDELGLARVEFHGPVYENDKIRILAEADIFTLPSRSENFALTVAESLMLGVPVVASKGAPWPGLETEGCGRWIDYGSTPMAEALRELMCLSETQRRDMGARGRCWMIREFTWPSIARKSLLCYQTILESGL